MSHSDRALLFKTHPCINNGGADFSLYYIECSEARCPGSCAQKAGEPCTSCYRAEILDTCFKYPKRASLDREAGDQPHPSPPRGELPPLKGFSLRIVLMSIYMKDIVENVFFVKFASFSRGRSIF